MSARDPETGQFVSGGGDDPLIADRYDELDVQTIESNFTLTNPQANGGAEYWERAHTFEPAEGLARNQRAELVGLTYATDLREYSDTSVNTAGNIVWWYELHRNGDFVAQQEKDIDQSDLTATGGSDTGNLGTNFRTDMNAGTLVKDHQTYEPQFANATDANGGGADNNARPHSTFNFRLMFGEGPLFWPDDTLNESVEAMTRNLSQSGLQLGFDRDILLYWDIFEVEESMPRRVPGR